MFLPRAAGVLRPGQDVWSVGRGMPCLPDQVPRVLRPPQLFHTLPPTSSLRHAPSLFLQPSFPMHCPDPSLPPVSSPLEIYLINDLTE